MSPARRSGDGDLHGNAPDDCPIALLIIDAINDFDYEHETTGSFLQGPLLCEESSAAEPRLWKHA